MMLTEALAELEAGCSVIFVAHPAEAADAIRNEAERLAKDKQLPFRTGPRQPWKPLLASRAYLDDGFLVKRGETPGTRVFFDETCDFGRQHCPPPLVRTVFV